MSQKLICKYQTSIRERITMRDKVMLDAKSLTLFKQLKNIIKEK